MKTTINNIEGIRLLVKGEIVKDTDWLCHEIDHIDYIDNEFDHQEDLHQLRSLIGRTVVGEHYNPIKHRPLFRFEESNAKPKVKELRFVSIECCTVPYTDRYQCDVIMYGLTSDGEIWWKRDIDTKWNKESMVKQESRD